MIFVGVSRKSWEATLVWDATEQPSTEVGLVELGVRENCVSCLFIVVMFIELDGTNKWGRHHLSVGASYKLGQQLLYGVLTSPATTKWFLSM